MRKISFALILCMLIGIFALTGCGAENVESSPYDGKWVGVIMKVSGLIIPVSDASDKPCYLNFLNAKELKAEINGEYELCKWSIKGEELTIYANGGSTVGTVINDNAVVFENMFNSGGSFLFAREGSAEANPDLYIN